MSEELEFVINADGVATLYDDTYDITIHCESQEEQDEAIRRMKAWQWIPCSERLPDTPDAVLVTIDWGDGDYEVSIEEYWSIDGVATEGWGDRDGKVIAWMPLPEPYKEGEQE